MPIFNWDVDIKIENNWDSHTAKMKSKLDDVNFCDYNIYNASRGYES